MNTPYVKQYDKNGQLENPILTHYSQSGPNRKQRRPRKSRFFGNGKNTPLTLTGPHKYLRVRQITKDKDGKRKVIEQYILQ
jgi:hypothetical protein